MSSGASDVIALAVLAALLSLLPVVILFWVYYLKERAPSVPARAVTIFFAGGMLTVVPALLTERAVYAFTQFLAPAVSSAFFTDFFKLEHASELALAFIVAFGVVALIEETLRYAILRYQFARAPEIDQVIDGIQLGVAAGLGFAFIENTLYFLRLFQGHEFGTLAVVFFLRFLISTFGHIAFGGIMGYHLAQALANPMTRRLHLFRAFWMPWMIHGLFDILLSVRLSVYTVLFLTLPVAALWILYRTPSLRVRFRISGRYLRAPIADRPRPLLAWPRPPVDVLPLMPWCPTCLAPLPRDPLGGRPEEAVGVVEQQQCPACGTRFRQRTSPALLRWAASAKAVFR